MSDYLEATSAALALIKDDASSLMILARAFNTTGNYVVADNLFSISESLRLSSENLDNAIGAEIHDRFHTAQQATANMINSCLVMSQIKDQDGTAQASAQ
jgi:hypothetical protein